MAIDRLKFGVLFSTQKLDFSDETNTIDPVGLSQLKPYLSATYGPEVPRDRQLDVIAESVFSAATALSTDEWLARPIDYLPHLVPHFLKFITPLINATDRLGVKVERTMDMMEAGKTELTKASGDDLTFGTSLFDIITIATAVELDIKHARFTSESTNGAIAKIMPASQIPAEAGKPEQPGLLSLLLMSNYPTQEHRRTIAKLRHKAEKMAIDAEVNVVRVNNILANFRGE